MAIIGLRNYRIVKLLTDTEETLEYDTKITRLTGAKSVKISPKVDSAENYGDDQLLETASAMGAIEVEIEVADLTLEERALILGYQYKDGVLIEDKNFNPPNLAFGFESPKSQNGSRMVWLTKGVCEPFEEEAKTKEDKIEFQSQKIKLKFMPRIHDGRHKITADTDVENAPTDAQFFTTDFLKTGVKPTTPAKANLNK
ncbi:TPA: phage tail protein [Clostridioides difficile]|uniref:Phage major tail protein, phi13 family n=3 Tax=Clostridioides difficile TaxID=1496 RepID=A0A9X8WQI0_CLODI|nr:major tail protein [Clostridioides difficile]EGT4828234.1 phage tail protein [Clostridioides difficile]EGT4931036.1 phage tail protein [Clostridioides difficile]EKG1351230.1 phage tail protein [Clostridioides difficile]EKJ1291169.1 phage tail protein [Clostridioides difficile]EKJ1366802.1 phage tail protein [Clostridioides difficile]